MNRVVRFWHLSDLHLYYSLNVDPIFSTCPSKTGVLEGLAELLGDSIAMPRDGVIVTGDICDTGCESNIGFASSMFRNPDTETSPWLRLGLDHSFLLPDAPVFLMPGNHDRFTGPLSYPGGRLFDDKKYKLWNNVLGVDQVLMPSESPALAVVAADFSLGSIRDAWPGGYLGQGRCGKETLGELRRRTESIRAEHLGIGVIWAIHFPPMYETFVPSPLWRRLEAQWLKLIGGEAVVELAAELGVTHVVSGHMHNSVAYSAGEGLTVCCAGTAAGQGGEIPSVCYCQVAVDGCGSTDMLRDEFVWRASRQRWVHADT